MFGLGMPEILLILAIALIVIGPKKLPDLAKTLGRAMGEFKRSAQDFKRSIDIETTVTDLKDIADPKIDLEGIIKEADTKKKSEPENEDLKDDDKKAQNNDADDADKEPDDVPNEKSDDIKSENIKNE